MFTPCRSAACHFALSYLHEVILHPASARSYGIPLTDAIRPENAFLLRPDEYLRQHQAGGRTVSVWLRMEHLFDDVVAFVDKYVQPVTPEIRQRLAAVATKGQRKYNHDIDAFFTAEQIAALYAKFPVWTEIEQRVYGSLYRHGGTSLAA